MATLQGSPQTTSAQEAHWQGTTECRRLRLFFGYPLVKFGFRQHEPPNKPFSFFKQNVKSEFPLIGLIFLFWFFAPVIMRQNGSPQNVSMRYLLFFALYFIFCSLVLTTFVRRGWGGGGGGGVLVYLRLIPSVVKQSAQGTIFLVLLSEI